MDDIKERVGAMKKVLVAGQLALHGQSAVGTLEELKDRLVAFYEKNREAFRALTPPPPATTSNDDEGFQFPVPVFRSSSVSSKEFYRYCLRNKITYDGQRNSSVLEFLDRIEDARVRLNIPESDIVNLLAEFLHGDANLWMRSNINSFDSQNTYKDFVEKFRSSFLPPDFESTLRNQIQNRFMSDSETLEMFIIRLKLANLKLQQKFSEDEILELVKSNSLEKYLVELNRESVKTLDDAIKVGRMIESISRKAERYKKPKPENSVDTVLNNYSLPKGKQHCSESSKHGRAHLDVVNKGHSRTSDSRKCWNCNSTGHVHMHCKKPKNGKIFCYKCGNPNVRKQDCPKCKQSKNEGTDI